MVTVDEPVPAPPLVLSDGGPRIIHRRYEASRTREIYYGGYEKSSSGGSSDTTIHRIKHNSIGGNISGCRASIVSNYD